MIERMPFLLNLRFQLQRLQWLTASLIAGLAAAAVIAATAGVQVAHAQMRSGGVDHLPALGEASVDELSPAAEQRLGDQIYQEFLRAGVIHDDPEVTDYLTKQASRLLDAATLLGHSEAGRPFQFFVVKDPTLNAFALPGGYIGVHTGLITASPRESEIMSVLAHEIGHVTQRHIARMFGQQRQSSAVMIAAALLAALAAQASPDAAMGVLSLGQTMAIREQLAFSRSASRENARLIGWACRFLQHRALIRMACPLCSNVLVRRAGSMTTTRLPIYAHTRFHLNVWPICRTDCRPIRSFDSQAAVVQVGHNRSSSAGIVQS